MPLGPSTDTLAALAPAMTALRLSLHVLAASVWVGGQITVAGLLGTVRGFGEGAPRAIARTFGRLEWPAFALLIATGVWNVLATHPSHESTAWKVVLAAKIAVALAAGLAAWLHQRARSRAGLAAYGAVTALASLVALVLGVLLAG
ncbi:MAG: hypothetical protein M0Z33_03020 [Actinomycetota bacterium]|nr:hypothetical protein [Actinomycetota bacterium]